MLLQNKRQSQCLWQHYSRHHHQHKSLSWIITTNKHNHGSQQRQLRNMALAPPPKTVVFDKEVHMMHKNYSATLTHQAQFDYLRDEMTENMLERIPLISRSFPKVAEIGSGKGYFLSKLLKQYPIESSQNNKDNDEIDENSSLFQSLMKRSNSSGTLTSSTTRYPIEDLGIEYYAMCDDSELLLRKDDFGLQWTDPDTATSSRFIGASNTASIIQSAKIIREQQQQDQESKAITIDKIKLNTLDTNDSTAQVLGDFGKLPFEERSMDLVLGGVYMHWINNLQGYLANIRSILRPDGAFMGAMLGGDTLHELRTSFVLAEQEREGGVSPHVSPLVSIRDAGNLLAGAGFSIPTIDSDVLTVYYPDAFTLMNHLQAMGENNCLLARRPNLSRETIYAAAALYDSLFRTEKGVPATFEIIYMIGWAPDPSQKKAARRGSAQIHLKDLAREMGTSVHVAAEPEEQ